MQARAPQYRSVQEWLESRREAKYMPGPANDLTGTAHWSTTNLMPRPPATAYSASAVPAAGAKLMKGFPASMQFMQQGGGQPLTMQ